MSSPAEPTPDEIRLGELVDRFEQVRAADASVGVGSLHDEAGELFPELADLAECLGLLKMGFGEEADEIPARIGRYHVEALLGSGVSGAVYRARQPESQDAVALKVLRESLILSKEGRERFLREIRVAEKLDHPHIVRLLDHGDVDGRPYLAMELVDGGSLADLLDRISNECAPQPDAGWVAMLDAFGVPPLGRAAANPAEEYARRMAALFAPVADALAHAAQAGLVHRDLKPGNLMLTRDGRLKLGDFGLARAYGEEITSTVAVLGTPGFMSPEQAAGRSREVDARTDVYGLGATLYQALTLRYPVEGDSFGEVLAAILSQEPRSLRGTCTDYPPALDRIVLRCLEKQPEDRYPDAALLARDLERVAAGREPRAARLPLGRRAQRFVRRHRVPFAASGAAALLLAAGLWWFTRPALVEVRVWPGGAIALDGTTVAQNRWTARVARGAHELTISRERFRTTKRDLPLAAGDKVFLDLHLVPEDPFDRDALSQLAKAYEVPPLPTGEPVHTRGIEKAAVPAPRHPEAVEEELARYPEDLRAEPHVRLLAAAALLERKLYADAYHVARELADAHPGKVEPLRLALQALTGLGLEGSVTYGELRARYEEAKDG